MTDWIFYEFIYLSKELWVLFFISKNVLIGGKLLYNVVLVSAIKQHKSAIIIPVSSPFCAICTMKYYSAIKKNKTKKQIWVSSSEVDEPRACYTEWSKGEREKQIKCINEHIWNLEKWWWWTCLQGRNGYADTENRFMDTLGEGKSGLCFS